jgi:hypothetical protein
MRLEPLYRVRFSYAGGWSADLAGQDSAAGRFFFLAEGRCEGRISGLFRGANHTVAAMEPSYPTSRASSRPTTGRRSTSTIEATVEPTPLVGGR